MLPLLDLDKLGAKHIHGNFPVLELAALHLAGYHNPCGNMGETHRRGGFVDLLAPRPAGAVDVHLDVLLPDLHRHIGGDLRHHLQRGEGGLTAARSVKGGDPDQAVNPCLRLEVAVGVKALHQDGSGLDAGFVPVQVVQDLIGEALLFDVHGVHPVEHLGPVLGLGAARPGVEGEDGVAAVVLPGEEGGEGHGLHLLLEGVGIFQGFLVDRVVLLPQSQLDEGEGVVVQGGEAAVAFQLALYRPGPLEDLLGSLGVVPKARFRGALVQLLALHLQPVNIQGLAQLPEGGLHSCQAQSQFVQFQHRHNKISLLHHKIGPGACQSLFIVSYFLANVKALARVFVLIPSPAPAQGPLQDRESQSLDW